MAIDLVTRILEHDSTIWGPKSVAPNRIGWIDLVDRTSEYVLELTKWAESIDQSHIVVLGMGGSSLGPRLFADLTNNLKIAKRKLSVVDSTDPRSLEEISITDTAFIVSSKSGTTVESDSYFKFFYARVKDPKRFIVITDPGTVLDQEARELGVARVFNTPENVGGRFSVFTEFGLVPAVLAGIDLEALLSAAKSANLDRYVNFGLSLGEAANDQNRFAQFPYGDKSRRSISMWTEQILAESTGKEKKGIIPVTPTLEDSDYRSTITEIDFSDLVSVAKHLYGMQFATAAAGYALGIDPFNEPDVGVSKEITRRVLAGEKFNPTLNRLELDELEGYITEKRDEGKYFSISAYQPLSFEDELYLLRDRLAEVSGPSPVAAGLAPRHLHSTGQLHKGGPANLELIQIVSTNYGPKIDIPGRDSDFGSLIRAQADGDAIACQDRGQAVSRIYV
ncbi:MAG: hypothetical protein M0019_01670 [Actinomycetota bacterium]|nr:hypothetical protein [Actinomycetota bacterium]